MTLPDNLEGASVESNRIRDGTHFVRLRYERTGDNVPYTIGQMKARGFEVCSVHFAKDGILFTRDAEE